MKSKIELFDIGLICVFLACFFFVIFGQVTVRKLRKNSETKNQLGFEFVSGWDVVNAAHTLAMPYWVTNKLKQSPLSYLEANASALRKHTSSADRFLAKMFCFFCTFLK